MSPVTFSSVRIMVAFAVWPLLGAAGWSAWPADTGFAEVETDRMADPGFVAGVSDIERNLESERDDRPPARMSLRKASRRVSPPRSVARSSPGATPIFLTGRRHERPSRMPTVRSAAVADLPRFCRWQL